MRLNANLAHISGDTVPFISKAICRGEFLGGTCLQFSGLLAGFQQDISPFPLFSSLAKYSLSH
jgi:hypothetical protein